MQTTKSAVWKLSSSLKRAQLQSIATSIGAPISGTKAQLQNGIHELVAQTLHQNDSAEATKGHGGSPQELRVLSIDMGIRNLAFAFLTCQMATPHAESSSTTFSQPELQKWRKFELFNIEKLLKNKFSPGVGSKLVTETAITQATLAESFEPSVLAEHAYTFAKYCASLQPTHILIERQRFRSAGHAAVLEWSLRVGMLEAMLHSTFRTFTEEKILSNVSVESVLPMRVNKFWFADREDLISKAEAEGTPKGSGNKQAKLAKIALVGDMLENRGRRDSSFLVHESVGRTVQAFLTEVTRTPNTRKGQTSLEKLDDVADSLLQGLAWLKWQENRRKLLLSGGSDLEPEKGTTAGKRPKRTSSKRSKGE